MKVIGLKEVTNYSLIGGAIYEEVRKLSVVVRK
jgi:hypothetical protein